jgi:hypothetical protein
VSLRAALVTLGFGFAVVVIMLWKVPDPNHEFMMNLCERVLGQETEQVHAQPE